jgi:hypothetical protein
MGDTDWWNKVQKYIYKNGITKVIIIAGSHFNQCLKESEEYLEDRRDFLTTKNTEVELHTGYSPDEDLVFSRYAKHFITTGGGYGFFLGNIVKLNGGNFVLNGPNLTIRSGVKLF